MAECKQEVPEQEALLLEFPGIATNPEAVLDSFGGQEAVSQVLGGTRDALHLKLRPEDPLAQPMLGLKQPTHGLLLRLSRKAGDPLHEGVGGVKAEVIAQVKSSVRFRGMADFQYVSCDTRPQAKQVPQAAGPFGFEPEPLMCPPQLFSKQDVPQDYAFRSYYGSDPDSFKAGAATGRGTGRMAAHFINFQGLHVPQPLQQSGAAGPAAEVGLQLSKRQMLRAAAGLFADKAVRSQPEVQDSVPGMTSPDADLILPKLAYIFRNGPWKGLWVQRGYDPRTDPAAAKRQAIEVPRRTQMLSSNPSSAKVTYQDVCRLVALPGDSSIAVPLEDFVEQAVASQLDKAVHLPACTLETGWFAKDDADRMTRIMAESFQRLQLQTRPLEHASGTQPLHGPAPSTSAPDRPQDVQQPSSSAGLPAPAAAAQQLPLPLASHTLADASMGEADDGYKQPTGPAVESNARGAPEMRPEIGKHSSSQRILPEEYLQGMLEDLHGNTTAFGLSAAAAKTLRDTAQEDFETFEASEVDKSHDKDNKTPDEGDFSGEDDHMEE